ncbi:MAG: MBL fold metallo-hydrolase [Pseudomonadota bacterium]|nr:MBL fold metallo-hydrolase [Pseudomonadota bacterium]
MKFKFKIIHAVIISTFIFPGLVASSEDQVPLLMPGTKMPFKLWEVEEVAKNVFAFRYSFYRNFFIVTEEGVIATDPLSEEAAQIMRKEIRKLTDQPVKYVAYTHSHWDHSAGGKIFKNEGAIFVAQKICETNLKEFPNQIVVMPDITYDDYYKIELGEQSVEMFYFGPSHDNCLVAMLINPSNQLFLVDIANPPDGWGMFYNPAVSEDRPWHMVRFFSRLQKLVEDRNIKTVIGGHMSGGIDPVTKRQTIMKGTTGPATVVKERLEFWTAITKLASEELAAGTPPEKIPEKIVSEKKLNDKISGYDPEKMRVLMKRMTNLAVTGE